MQDTDVIEFEIVCLNLKKDADILSVFIKRMKLVEEKEASSRILYQDDDKNI